MSTPSSRLVLVTTARSVARLEGRLDLADGARASSAEWWRGDRLVGGLAAAGEGPRGGRG